MDIKSEYEKLYQHWLKEFRQIELTQLTKEIYGNYKKSLDHINNFKLEQEDKTKLEILNSYKENFNFIINDLSKIREIKLINAALALREIDLNNLLEAEKLFYQNLVSAIKGFEKVKAIEVVDSTESIKIKELLEVKLNNEIKPEKAETIIQYDETVESGLNIEKKDENFNYTLIKFLKKAPPLVGIDLVNYGPFEKEDIANIPYKNAKILLAEKIAEKINLS